MSLRIAFNATPLLSPITGIGNYILELGTALASFPDIDAYSFYRYRWRHAPPAGQDGGGGMLGQWVLQGIKPLVPFRAAMRHSTKLLGFSRGLREHRIDLYHEQNYVPLSYDVPVVITIHDLSWIRYPAAHPMDRVRWLDKGLPRALDTARAVLVDSEFIRREVLTTFGLDCESVHVAHLGVPRGFSPRPPSSTAQSLGKLGLEHGKFILTVGTIEPRKNLVHVLEAHALLPEALKAAYPLVIAGARGWRSQGMLTRLRSQDDRHVRFLGHVTSEELANLYSGAALFVFPSIYEGFGLPPLEAMACGAPVIVSDRSSLPEIVGDAGVMMNPEDPESTTATIQDLLADPGRRLEMSRQGIERASRFTWTRCAEVTRAVYRSALGLPEESSHPNRTRLDAPSPPAIQPNVK